MSVDKARLVGQCGLWRESLEKVEQRLMERLCVEGIDVLFGDSKPVPGSEC